MGKAMIREAPLGQLIRLVTRNKYMKYPEEEADFKLPDCWVEAMNNPNAGMEDISNDTETPASSASSTVADPDASRDQIKEKDEGGPVPEHEEKEDASAPEPSRRNSQLQMHRTISREVTRTYSRDRYEQEMQHEIEKVKSIPIAPKRTKSGAILVDWYYSDDAENPHNWTNNKRLGISLLICLYTFVVYTSSAIYTSSTEGVMSHFGVSQIKATLGLSLYVLGYGIGPLIFSPLSEIPRIGRNPVYIVTMFLFVIISIPTALVNSFSGLMALRFFQGFFGSPCLASGGASLSDMYSLMALPYAMMAWVSAAYCGRTSPPFQLP